jgi:tagatose 1,6-diphosphate aldolase GatY/KbaY
MPLSLPIEALRAARREGRAIAAFSVYDLEQAQAVCRAAEAAGEPVLLQAGSSAFAYAGRAPLAALALAVAGDAGIEVGVHLDHSRNVAEVRACLELGYTSVMFDGSDRTLAENTRLTAQVVEEAHAAGAWVEAELAGIAGDEDASTAGAIAGGLTDPSVAERFVHDTGVDALAVAIGNVHGIPALPVRLDLARLEAIRARVDVPLVLHGASGLDDGDVAGAIARGVAKINVNTELRRALRDGLAGASRERDDLPALLGPAREAMQRVAEEKIRFYAAGNQPKLSRDRADGTYSSPT